MGMDEIRFVRAELASYEGGGGLTEISALVAQMVREISLYGT